MKESHLPNLEDYAKKWKINIDFNKFNNQNNQQQQQQQQIVNTGNTYS